ncbi:hypothetical protein T492DRAFT_279081 [Pavlovales sp. CCMP2436]|nr:hypothetical protein T492DRAFT_279081 [Pavlovales sp. CCMP2436]
MHSRGTRGGLRPSRRALFDNSYWYSARRGEECLLLRLGHHFPPSPVRNRATNSDFGPVDLSGSGVISLIFRADATSRVSELGPAPWAATGAQLAEGELLAQRLEGVAQLGRRRVGHGVELDDEGVDPGGDALPARGERATVCLAADPPLHEGVNGAWSY